MTLAVHETSPPLLTCSAVGDCPMPEINNVYIWNHQRISENKIQYNTQYNTYYFLVFHDIWDLGFAFNLPLLLLFRRVVHHYPSTQHTVCHVPDSNLHASHQAGMLIILVNHAVENR